jgi:hypothetical protein
MANHGLDADGRSCTIDHLHSAIAKTGRGKGVGDRTKSDLFLFFQPELP